MVNHLCEVFLLALGPFVPPMDSKTHETIFSLQVDFGNNTVL